MPHRLSDDDHSPNAFGRRGGNFLRGVRRLSRVLRQSLEHVENYVNRRLRESYGFSRAGHLGGVQQSTRYNMVTSESEEFYADQYLKLLLDVVTDPKSILDLGTGHGRMAFKLARRFPEAKVIGSDISAEAIEFAQCEQMNGEFDNVHFVVEDLGQTLNRTTSSSVDLVVFTEVALFDTNLAYHLLEMRRVLKVGGLLAISFRSTYYNALLKVKQQNFFDLEHVVASNSGVLWESSDIQFNWYSSSEAAHLVRSAGLHPRLVSGIGVLSGIPGDPHFEFARPEKLADVYRAYLMSAEVALSSSVPDAGRYFLIVAERID